MIKRSALVALVAAIALAYPAHSTLTSTSNSVSYTGNSVTTSYTVPFKFLAASDLVVTVAGATKVLNSDYTVTGAGNATGTVKFSVAPASSAVVAITRVVPLTQPSTVRTALPFPAGATIDTALDRTTMQLQQLNAKEVADIGNVNNTVAAFNASGAAIGSTTSVLATGSTTPRTLAARAADIANVKDWNAKGDGVTDDTVAIDAAQAAVLTTGKTLFFPCGNYLDSHAITVGSSGARIQGAGKACTTITFTGATDGIAVADVAPTVSDFQIDGLTLTTTNAAAGKALNLNLPLHGSFSGTIRDITVLASGSGRWAYCGYSNNWQTSEVFSLRCYQSATVGWHFDSASDAIDFYGLEIVGSTGAGTITRAIEVADTSGGADIRLFGGTLQGYFTNSLIWLNTVTKGQKFYGLHLENTNASPSDGADVVGIGTNVNTAFHGLQGGTFNIGSAGTWRNFVLEGSEVNAVVIGVGCVACKLDSIRAVSITDNSVTTTILASSSATGISYGSKISAALGKHNTATIPTISGTALNSSAGLTIANDATLDWLDSTGVSRETLRVSAANQTLLTYQPASQITFRNSTPTTKMVLTDTALTLQSGVVLVANDTKNKGTITLVAGTGTAGVGAGLVCACSDTTAANAVKCAVSGSTLTATGTGTDVIAYLCF